MAKVELTQEQINLLFNTVNETGYKGSASEVVTATKKALAEHIPQVSDVEKAEE